MYVQGNFHDLKGFHVDSCANSLFILLSEISGLSRLVLLEFGDVFRKPSICPVSRSLL